MCLEPESNLGGESEDGGSDASIRNELQLSISGVQATLEFTNEDDTRIRMRAVLKSLQRLQHHFEARRKAG